MSDIIVAHSHSAMDTFETCPKKYFEEKITKRAKFTESEASVYGKEVHKAFELYVKNGTPLPFGMQHYAQYLDKFKAAPGTKLVEQRMAINRQFESTGYFDDDVWFRGQGDLIILNSPSAIVVDYKTGKIKDSFQQLDLMAATTFCLDNTIEHITAIFFWTKGRKMTTKKYARADTMDIWATFINKTKRLELAIKTSDFPAKPGYLCKEYCNATSCPYNGE